MGHRSAKRSAYIRQVRQVAAQRPKDALDWLASVVALGLAFVVFAATYGVTRAVEELATRAVYIGSAVVATLAFVLVKASAAGYKIHLDDQAHIDRVEGERDSLARQLRSRQKRQAISDALWELHSEGIASLYRTKCSTREHHQEFKSARQVFIQRVLDRMREMGCTESERRRITNIGHVDTKPFRDSYKYTPALKSRFQAELDQIKAIAESHDTTTPSRSA